MAENSPFSEISNTLNALLADKNASPDTRDSLSAFFAVGSPINLPEYHRLTEDLFLSKGRIANYEKLLGWFPDYLQLQMSFDSFVMQLSVVEI
ncbi:MAG: hypothetical protein V2I33_16215 [Kangiellaceae bacterium]|jgi:hypothetical protein|nr:hypothetical protein [Kangiellaceae bacterium]